MDTTAPDERAAVSDGHAEPEVRRVPRVAGGRAIATVMIAAVASVAGAQTRDGRRPAYEAMRYDEDWSVLRDSSDSTDLWDPWKYVALSRPDWYLTFGGEARTRYELLDRPVFGTGPEDRNGYILQRYLFSADAHFGRRLRAFGEIQSGLANGRAGGPRPTDLNRFDVHQGFVDALPFRSSRSELRMRVGRQEMTLGSGRLISAAEGLNVRRSFDGVRTIYRRDDLVVNAGWLRLVKAGAGVFDDEPDPDLSFWGLGVIGRHRLWPGAGFSAYYFGLDRRRATFAGEAGHAQRQTLGSRSWKAGGRFDFNHEVILQWGTFQGRRIRAWGVSSDVGVNLATRLRPRFGVRFDATSGDRHRGDRELNSFDPLFPSAIAYSGNSSLVGPTNLIDIAPTVRVSPLRQVTIALGAPVYWRQSTGDGVYAITGATMAGTGGSTARHVGANPDLSVSWQVDGHTSVTGLYSRFLVGRFLRDSISGTNVHYAFTAINYRF